MVFAFVGERLVLRLSVDSLPENGQIFLLPDERLQVCPIGPRGVGVLRENMFNIRLIHPDFFCFALLRVGQLS